MLVAHVPPSPLCAPTPVFPQVISPEKTEPTVSPGGIQTELDEEMENDICKVWDMSMDEVGPMGGGRTSRVVRRILLEAGEGTELRGLGQLSDFDGVDYSLVWPAARCESLGRAGVVNWHQAGSSQRLLFKWSK